MTRKSEITAETRAKRGAGIQRSTPFCDHHFSSFVGVELFLDGTELTGKQVPISGDFTPNDVAANAWAHSGMCSQSAGMDSIQGNRKRGKEMVTEGDGHRSLQQWQTVLPAFGPAVPALRSESVTFGNCKFSLSSRTK